MNRIYLLLKPYQDRILAIIGLIVLSPFLLLIAVLILIESPGASPIFA